MRQVDKWWEEAFDKLDLLARLSSAPIAVVTARELKGLGREPRLMAKFDHSRELPQLFRDLRLGILPTSNDAYAIGHFNIFHPVSTIESSSENVLPASHRLESLESSSLTSEASLLHFSLSIGVLEHFVGEELVQTLSGRRRTGAFQFNVDSENGSQAIDVSGAQIEIDGGYEGLTKVLLIEAKNRDVVDFNIRQLYYPLRTLVPHLTKQVLPVLITRREQSLLLREYKFEELGNFSSIKETRAKIYNLTHEQPASRRSRLAPIAERAVRAPILNPVTFPQANDFMKVIQLTEILLDRPRSTQDLAYYFDFDPRQARYYLDASKYLGLAQVRFGNDSFRASRLAKAVFAQSGKERDAQLAELVLENEPFALVFLASLRAGRKMTNDEAYRLVKTSRELVGFSESTIRRRVSTIQNWLGWLQGVTAD